MKKLNFELIDSVEKQLDASDFSSLVNIKSQEGTCCAYVAEEE